MPKRKSAKSPRDETSALYVRLPLEEAEKLDRIAFEHKLPKREVIRTLVADHLDADVVFTRRLPDPATLPFPPGPGPVVGRAEFVPADAPEVLTVEQAAELLQTDGETIADLAERGELPARKVGDDWRFLRRALLDWLGG